MEAHTHLYIFTYMYMYVCHYWRTLTATLCTVWKVSLANFYKSYKMHTHTNPHTKSMWANLQSRIQAIKIHKSKYTTQRQCCQFAENERIFVCRAQTHKHTHMHSYIPSDGYVASACCSSYFSLYSTVSHNTAKRCNCCSLPAVGCSLQATLTTNNNNNNGDKCVCVCAAIVWQSLSRKK